MSRRRAPKPRLLTVEERKELDELIAEQSTDDRNWITGSRYAASLDAVLANGEDGDVTMKDLMVMPPDWSPFGVMRMLAEDNGTNTKDKTRVYRRPKVKPPKREPAPVVYSRTEWTRGCSSDRPERHVANVEAEGSTPSARFEEAA